MSEPRPAPVGHLLDVNVWLALAIDEHIHHPAAVAYWSAHREVARFFCRLSCMGFVRLLAQPKLMGKAALDLEGAWALYQRFIALPGVAMLSEPEGVDAALAGMIKRRLPARLFTDAYLAALARAAGLALVTFDKDFERFAGLQVQRLQPAATA